MRFKLLAFLLLFVAAFPSWAQGLRNLKPGDKLPDTPALSIFKAGEQKLILYFNSSRDKNTAFYKELVSNLGTSKDIDILYLVDTNSEMGPEVSSSYSALTLAKQYVPDVERKIYGELGIIVLPTLIFVNGDNVLHSVVAGSRSNLNLVLQSHLKAFAQGVPPEDVAQSAANQKKSNTLDRLNEQAFQLMVGREYELAHSMYTKALKTDPNNEIANLGMGYALIFMQKTEEASEHFLRLKEAGDSKRPMLGFYLSSAIKTPTEENLKELASYSQLESNFFFVIFKAAQILDKAGKSEESKMAYKQAYDVLLRTYRRRP